MILVALGSNIAGPWGSPAETVARALAELNHDPLKLVVASRLLLTAPFGKPDQPSFVNAVAQIETHLPPGELLQKLHGIEKSAGRKRAERWGPRTLDLDLIDYNGMVIAERGLTVPHPGIAERIFVLRPIAEIAPKWRHPLTQKSAQDMLTALKGVSEGGEI
jgi:2-amino-4-hydroxy-6-hydroxymethyldihydropteridine diphosphokinase